MTCVVAALLLSVPPIVLAQDSGEIVIEQVEWGFDGKAVQRTFTPLSVLISNPGSAPAEGTLQLTRAVQLTHRVGAVCEEEYYLSPAESRWVQFTPYVMGDWENWFLTWGAGADQKLDIPTPRSGDPAVVLIDDPDDLDIGGSLRRFNQMLFPVSVTGTDGLEAVVLNLSPDWQGARAQAFVEWLHRGGRVYIAPGRDGRYPEFSGELGILNEAGDRTRVGAGLVKRLDVAAGNLDRSAVESLIIDDEQPAGRAARMVESPFMLSGMVGWDRDQQLLIDLVSLVRFHRNWWLVYTAVLLYLLTLYPGCYYVGRHVPNIRTFYAGFFGSTILFSLLFVWLGGIGGGEINRARTVATAYRLEEGLFDVTQWSSVAVVDGGFYDLQHAGTGRLYSTCQEIESVNGTITTGAGGGLVLDMPPVSTRTVLHRTRLSAPGLGLRVDSFLADELGLSALALSCGDQFPRDVTAAYAAYKGRIYTLNVVGKRLMLTDRGAPTQVFLQSFELYGWQQAAWRAPVADVERPDGELVFDTVLRTLVGNSYGLTSQAREEALILPPDLVRVFVYVPLPAAFKLTGDDFPDQEGRVLYVVDLPVASEPPRQE